MNIFAWFRKRDAAVAPAPKAATETAAPINAAPEAAPAPIPVHRATGAVGIGPKTCELKVGMELTELRNRRRSPCVVARVQANGRRVVVRQHGSDRVHGFTLRPDGIYRLESAPLADGVPRLVLD
jgi:hypothetical protein